MGKYTITEKTITMQLQWFINLRAAAKCKVNYNVNRWEKHTQRRCQVSTKKRVQKMCYRRKCFIKLNQKVSASKKMRRKVKDMLKAPEKHMAMVGNRLINCLSY
jgi:hypothetical protein